MNENKIENNLVLNTNKDKCYTVYMHVSPSNKRYIGITRQEPEKRWKSGNGYAGNDYFYKAIKKYGWNNFEHNILFSELTKTEAEQKEIELISHYRSDEREFGYNFDHGGNCVGSFSDEHKLKIGKAQIGLKAVAVDKYDRNGYYICTYSSVINAADKHSVTHTAISACCRGVLKTVAGYIWRYSGEELTDEHLNWCNKDDTGYNKKAVCQYSLSGDFIEKFESAEIVNKLLGFNATNIRKCCRYEAKTSNGYIWQYDDVELTQEYIDLCNNAILTQGRKVCQLSLAGEQLNVYQSIRQAAKYSGVSRFAISKCCKEEQDAAGGYIWRYV